MRTQHILGIILIALPVSFVAYQARNHPAPAWSTSLGPSAKPAMMSEMTSKAIVAAAVRQDPTALRMEKTGLLNQLANLKAKYPLLNSELSGQYEDAWNERRYQLSLYRLLQPVEERLDKKIREHGPSVEAYADVVNSIRSEFYRVCNDRSVTNRSAALGQILAKEKTILSAEVFAAQAREYERLTLEALRAEDLPSILQFNAAMEQAVVAGDPNLKDIARQGNNYCVAKAALVVRLNYVEFQLAALQPLRAKGNPRTKPDYIPPLWTMY